MPIKYEVGKNIKTIFCSPLTGDIHIILPRNAYLGRNVLVKDISNDASHKLDRAYNVKIYADDAYVENHQYSKISVRAMSTNEHPYVIDSNGGAVTFSFFHNRLLCSKNQWLVVNEFVGTYPSSGRISRSLEGEEKRSRIITPLIHL